MKQLNDIDKLFKDALDGRRETVPPDIWKAVDEGINRKLDISKVNYNKVTKLIKLFGALIFLSSIFFVYRSMIDEAIKHTTNTVKLLSSHSSVKNTTANKLSKEPSNRKPKLIVVDSAEARHQKTGHSRTSLFTPNKYRPSENKNSIDGSMADRELFIKSGKNENSVNSLYAEKQDRSLATASFAGKKKDSIGNGLKGAWLPDVISWSTIQPLPFVYKVKGVQPPADNTLNPSLMDNINTVKLHASHKISIEPFGSINYSHRNLVEGKRQGGRGFNKEEVGKSEEPGSSFSVGVLINYGLKKDLFLQSGLGFSSVKTTSKAGKIYARADDNGRTKYELISSSGYSFFSNHTGISLNPGDSIAINGSSSAINYINLPLSINYALNRGKFALNPGLGLSANFLTHSRTSISVGTSFNHYLEKTTVSGLNNIYLDGLFGLGIEYKLTPKLSLEIKPLVRLGLTPINDETPVRTFQNYVNLEAGMKIKL